MKMTPQKYFCTLKTRQAGNINRLRDREIGQLPCTDQSNVLSGRGKAPGPYSLSYSENYTVNFSFAMFKLCSIKEEAANVGTHCFQM